MRLLYFLGDGTLAFTDFGRQKPPPYAILSHTWGEEEVSFQDLSYGVSSNLAGFKKIAFCGEQAAKDGLKYFWVDTCSIDRTNMPELTRSINSMFRWYRNAAKCYAYLSDLSVTCRGNDTVDEKTWLDAFRDSRWFTRGWTLQELIAPGSVEFFSREGFRLGDKRSLEAAITEITGIPAKALRSQPLTEFSVEERFAWASGRETTEEEDIAYCLLGIFDVFMPLIPGEGEANAMKRLEKLVDESLHDKALGGPDHTPAPSSSPAVPSKSTPRNAEATEKMKAYVHRRLGSRQALPWPYKMRVDPNAQVVLNHWHRAYAISPEVAQGANAGSIFHEAHASFTNDVFWDEWPSFEAIDGPETMMRDIRKHCKQAKNSSRLLTSCYAIERFCSRWVHFFDVVELGMTVLSDWPQTFWSAIRIVFVRCTEFVNVFEKIAQLFDKLNDRLPSYHDHVLRLRRDCPDAAKSDLCKALAIVYADILQFCHDACTLLRMSPAVLGAQLDPVKNLTFIPFAVAFHDLLERVTEHKRLFDISLRTGKHDDLQAFIARVVKALQEREEYMQEEVLRRNLEKDKQTHNQLFHDNVRKWIQSPEFKVDFDKAIDARSLNTGQWLKSEASYVAWKEDLHSLSLTSKKHGKLAMKKRKSILLLEGPPGYGKTVLSTVVIEDLKSSVMASSEPSDTQLKNTVAYFYFNAQLPGKQSCFDAFRGLALQVVEVLQKDPGMVDMLSLLRLHFEDNPNTATFEELAELLRLAARRFSSLAFVLDGIDECLDFRLMWPFLGLICDDPRSKCLCFTRPSIQIPPELLQQVQRYSLHGKNGHDIRRYLQKETQALQHAGYLGQSLQADHVAYSLSKRADSRFLWANLIVSYLRSESLNPEERMGIVEDPGQLDSLHGLFSGIIRQYQTLYFSERSLLTKILQLLVLAKEPLSVEQLNIAVSTVPGRKLEKTDLLPNFLETLKKLCGSLIEVTESAVLFSHLSFRAFLESKDAIDFKNSFRIDKKAGSLQFAVVCLSYLIHHVPQRPLSGEIESAIDREEIEQRWPLARYAARYWVTHAVSALRLMPGAPRELMLECHHLLQQLGSFIMRKPSISSWIETCWTYRFPASITELWLEFERRLAQIKITAQRGTSEWRIFEALCKVRDLSADLERLNEHWSHLLLARPYEIWGPSISVFLGPVSWANNEEATTTTIANNESEEVLEDTILKVSRLSSCGTFMGIFRLFRTRSYGNPETSEAPCLCRRKPCSCENTANPVDLRNTAATYQILRLEDGFPIVDQVDLFLRSEDLREVESTASGKKFRFPVAFAPNLRSISILHTLYWFDMDGVLQQHRLAEPHVQEAAVEEPIVEEPSIRDEDESLDSDQSQSSMKLPKPIEIWQRPQIVGRQGSRWRRRLFRRSSKTPLKNFSASDFKHTSTERPTALNTSNMNKFCERFSGKFLANDELRSNSTKPRYYKVTFSPCGRFLARLERQQDMNIRAMGRWDIVVWRRQSAKPSMVSSKDDTWKEDSELRNIYSDFSKNGTFTFNPRFLQVALYEQTTDSPNEVSVWNFGTVPEARQSHRTTRMIYATGLDNLHISSCGHYLFGDHPFFKNPRIVELERYLRDAVPIPALATDASTHGSSTDTRPGGSVDVDMVDASEQDYMQIIRGNSKQSFIPQDLRQPVLLPNELVLTAPNGAPELSLVRRGGDGGVILKRFSSATNDSESLLYLPKTQSASTSVSILDDRQEDRDTVRMVLTNDFEDSYTWDNPSNRQSASIVTRSAQSIARVQNGASEISGIPNSNAQKLLSIEEEAIWQTPIDIDSMSIDSWDHL